MWKQADNPFMIKENRMKFQEIQKIAKEMNINTYRMKKADIIQAIQRTEKNIDCYGTNRVDYCEEQECSWRSDCLASNMNKKAKQKEK
jgi:hypothetical protein